MGLTGLEPVTMRLSSACSNQLSYRPRFAATRLNFRISIADFRIVFLARFVRNYLNRQSTIANRKLPRRHSGHGGKGIRTPDFQLAKLALYQLSYAPRQLQIVDCKIADCKDRRSWTAATVFFFRTDLAEPEMPDHDLASRDPASTFCQSVLWLLAVKRYRQVRGPDTISIDSSARNLAIIIYVFGAFEACRITAFEFVEVCGCVAVIPNNCTTIYKVHVARYADYLAGLVDTVSLAVDMFWRTALQRFEMPNAVLPGPHKRMYY